MWDSFVFERLSRCPASDEWWCEYLLMGEDGKGEYKVRRGEYEVKMRKVNMIGYKWCQPFHCDMRYTIRITKSSAWNIYDCPEKRKRWKKIYSLRFLACVIVGCCCKIRRNVLDLFAIKVKYVVSNRSEWSSRCLR